MNSIVAIAAQKAQLRRELRRRRIAIPLIERRRAARSAAFHLSRTSAFRRARRVAIYLAAGAELDTAPLLRALRKARKQVLVPQVDPVRRGLMHMAALPQLPRRARAQHPAPDLVIVPLIGYDATGQRLGSGGGYYDRWFARRPQLRPRIGYAYAVQRVERLPSEAWDLRLDAVCTERGMQYFSHSKRDSKRGSRRP